MAVLGFGPVTFRSQGHEAMSCPSAALQKKIVPEDKEDLGELGGPQVVWAPP